MTGALKQAKLPMELIIVKNAGHGYTFVAPSAPAVAGRGGRNRPEFPRYELEEVELGQNSKVNHFCPHRNY